MIKKVFGALKKVKNFFSGFPDEEVEKLREESNYPVCEFCKGEIESDKGEKKTRKFNKDFHVECFRDLKKIAKKQGMYM